MNALAAPPHPGGAHPDSKTPGGAGPRGSDPANGDPGPSLGRSSLLDLAAITALLALGVLAFGPAFAWGPGLRAGAVGVLAAAALALVTTWRRAPAVATANAAIVLYFALGGLAALPDTTIGGVIPTGQTLTHLARLTSEAWRDLLTASLPASTFAGPAVVPYLSSLALGTLAYVVALRGRRPLLAVPAALALLIVGILWGTRHAPFALAQGLAFGVIALGWSAWRSGRRTSSGAAVFHGAQRRGIGAPTALAAAALIAVGALVAAAAAPLLTPGARHVLRDDVVPPLALHTYPSPLTRYRALETDPQAQPLLTVTGLPPGARVRLATLDSYDGNVYRVDAASAGFQRAGDRIDSTSGTEGTPTQVRVDVRGLDGVWLPTVGTTAGVRFDGPSGPNQAKGLHYNPATGTAVTTPGIGDGTTYRLDAVATPRPGDAALAAAVPAAVALPMPQRVPELLRDKTTTVVGSAPTPAQQLANIVTYLRAGYFSNGSDGLSRAGHTSERIEALLGEQVLAGDDEQYAVAMALMARQIGLPARVVMGFVPPEKGADGGPITLTGSEARVWVEVAFEGLGWVTYDPTPDRSRVPKVTVPKPTEQPKPQVLPPPPPPQESAPPTVKAEESDPKREPETSRSILLEVLAVGGIVLGGLLVLASPVLAILAIKAVRRRRRRTTGSAADRVGHGWAEVLDRATDLGTPLVGGATRRECAHVIDERYPAAGSVALAERVDAHVFGPREPGEDDVRRLWRDVDAALAAVDHGLTRRTRWLSRISPASLRPRPRAGKATAKQRQPTMTSRLRRRPGGPSQEGAHGP